MPGHHKVDHDSGSPTLFGWAALRHALRQVPLRPGRSDIVAQVSSIAHLGAKDTWLRRTLFAALDPQASSPAPEYKVVFPTGNELRTSLGGLASGCSIVYAGTQKPNEAKQLQYLRPLLHHWANDDAVAVHENAGRNRAPPHIKTYIRYSHGEGPIPTIDWALLTSANLSRQAWGQAAKGDTAYLTSFEIGVLVWPELYDEGGQGGAVMLPAFGRDAGGSGGGEREHGCRLAHALRLAPESLRRARGALGAAIWKVAMCNKSGRMGSGGRTDGIEYCGQDLLFTGCFYGVLFTGVLFTGCGQSAAKEGDPG